MALTVLAILLSAMSFALLFQKDRTERMTGLGNLFAAGSALCLTLVFLLWVVGA